MISLLKAKKVYFGGKLVTTRFKKLSEDDKRQIINPNFMEMGIATLSDGCIIIDSDGPKEELFLESLKGVMSFDYESLLAIEGKYKKKYPKVKNFDDVIDISDTEGAAQAAEAMMVLIIPVEKARRSIAAGYYGLNNN